MTKLRLRPLRLDDEDEFRAGHRAMLESDNWHFGLYFDDDTVWADFVRQLENIRRNVDMPGGLVPAAFLVAVVEDVIVGRSSIRFELNDWLAFQGGHIGYGVLPDHRGNGYAAEILRQSLVVNRSHGVDPSLVCCDDDNVASAKTIERCGGTLDNIVDGDDGPVRRYWI